MNITELEDIKNIVVSIAYEAGTIARTNYRHCEGTLRSNNDFATKETEIDLVTQTDIASEELIKNKLSHYFPLHSFLAEEGGFSGSAKSNTCWVIDPLDGTTNFAHGHPFFCISIAMISEGCIQLGVIYAPILETTWTALRGGGSHRNGSPIHVSSISSLKLALCASGFPYDRHSAEDNNSKEWSAMLRKAQGLRRCGAAALDLALVADGTYDGYWEKRLKPWDIAAGALIVQEAGGKVTSLTGNNIPPFPELLVASNGLIHTDIVEILRG